MGKRDKLLEIVKKVTSVAGKVATVGGFLVIVLGIGKKDGGGGDQKLLK